MRVNERVPCAGTIEALHHSVFDFEYRTLKRNKICVGFFSIFFSSVITNFRPLKRILTVITDRIRIYITDIKKLTGCSG